jgi:hypothetical protein
MTDKPDTDDLEIEIVPEALEAGTPDVNGATVEAKSDVADTDGALAKLRADLEADNARLKAEAADANRRAAAAEGTAVQAQTAAQQSDLQLITGAIEQVKTTASVLQRNYAEAASAGDWEAASKIQWEMSEAAANLKQLEQGKASLESAPKPAAPQPRADDPVEAVAAQLSSKSADWVRAHPEFIRNPNLNRRLLAAHNLAETDGHPLDSPGYFEAIEQTLGLRLPGETRPAAGATDNPLSDASDPMTARSTPPAAAPVNRGNGGKRVVRLTPAQVEAAELSGLTAQQYAAQLERIEREKAGASLK